MTSPQRRILACILDSTERDGFPPTVKEIGRAVGLRSTSSVQYQLDALQAGGYVTREPGLCRSLRLTEKALAVVGAGREIGVRNK